MAKSAEAKRVEEKRPEAPPPEAKRPEPRERFEVEPPKRARCGNCRSEALRVEYTTRYDEAGIRRVTASCQACGSINWWDEALAPPAGGGQ